MGIYLFNTDFLFEQLHKDAANPASSRDFGKDIIPSIIGSHRSTPIRSSIPRQARSRTGATSARSTHSGKATWSWCP